MRRACLLALWLVAACGDHGGTTDAGAGSDGGGGDASALVDGSGPLRAGFSIEGCSTLDSSSGTPKCSGQAPLTVTFVPLGAGLSAYGWTFMGGAPSSSKDATPTVTFATPGTFAITLAAGEAGNTTTATGTLIVTTGETGAPCLADTDCDASAGLYCVCKPGQGGCSGALASGFCSRDCSGGICNAGELCADFTRGGAFVGGDDDGGAPDDDGGTGGAGSGGGGGAGGDSPSSDAWRRALCVPGCASDKDCGTGLSCRELPTLASGALAGSAYTWRLGCFADVGGDDGDSCFGADGQPDGARCLSGRCDDYGARGLCTSSCSSSSDCPLDAACATFAAPPGGQPAHACLVRCSTTATCAGDPLLDCEPAGELGGLGFSITPGETNSAGYCAPLRCSMASQCTPSGTCTPMGGGSYCIVDGS